jgi:hypothetical protein
MLKLTSILAACTLLPLLAVAQIGPSKPPDMQRISGTVKQWDGRTLTIQSAEGETQVLISADANINTQRPGNLSDIKPGSFVGSAAVAGPDGHLHANEVHIFPESMRGDGAGHRNMTAPNTTMTNGDVATMTNGNVAATGPGTTSRLITVTYPGGQQLIEVTSNVPISVITPVDRSLLKPGIEVNAMGRKDAAGKITVRMVEVVSPH